MKTLHVELGDRSYPIYIGEGLLEQAGERFTEHGISKKSPLMIITDDQVGPLYLNEIKSILQALEFQVVTATVPSGEKSKSVYELERLIGLALQGGLDRSSTIVALGGGVVGDLAGYVAASFMRGVRFVQIPTTILAHDSSVGGKVAVNHPLGKNIIGAFHQPEMVLYDTNTLRTLPPREVRAGLSEVVKHGLIWDKEFAYWCKNHGEELLSLDPQVLAHALYEGCKVKAAVVSEDEKEHGLRAILNLGHTIGHALEAVAEYNEILHGEAISIGMVGAARIAEQRGYGENLVNETRSILEMMGLPVSLPKNMDMPSILSAMSHDKKFREGRMVFILPLEIGRVQISPDITQEEVVEALEFLKREG